MKILIRSLVVSLLLNSTSVFFGQGKSESANVQFSQIILGTCEDNISFLSNAHHLAGADGTIIAIARLGNGERNRELNNRRLHNVRVYLTEFDWHRAPEILITAEGDRVMGYGRVELYVRGELFAVLEVRRNQDLLVGSCEPDDIRPVEAERNLYPYRDERSRRKKQ
ncbi:MAG: hypothetical protein ACREA9_15395 [Pyrinomonadaceae bacterium]